MRNRFLSIFLSIIFLLATVSTAMAATAQEGQPSAFGAGKSEGYFIWQEGDRWFLQTTTYGDRRQFTGTVRTNGRFTDVKRIRPEANDRSTVNNADNEIRFDLMTAGNSDGFSFRLANNADITFTLYLDGQPVQPSKVYIGRGNRHPDTNSFTLNLNDNYDYRNDNRSDNRDYNNYPIGSARFQGQPTFLSPGDVLGYFIWQEGDRLYLKTTTKGRQRQFSGTIRTEGRFNDVSRTNPQPNDRILVNKSDNEINFNLRTDGDLDGFSFRLISGATATFTLFLDGQSVDPSDVYLGSANLHPNTNSFTINLNDSNDNRNDNWNNNRNDNWNDNRNDFNSQSDSTLFQSEPTALNPGNVLGYFIWQDQNRWYLQTSTNGTEQQFRGVIETEGIFSDIQKLRSQRTDGIVVDASEHNISFSFKTGGSNTGISIGIGEGIRFNQPDRVSGLSFMVSDGSVLRFTLYVDGAAVNPANIYVGKMNWNPPSNVFQIRSKNF